MYDNRIINECQYIKTVSANQLMKMDLPEQRFAVKGIIHEGLTLLAGKPKRGKSWFALQVSISVSQGIDLFNRYAVKKCGVLYLALEDNERRLKTRLTKHLQESAGPENLILATEIPRASEGGLGMIDKYLEENPHCGLVIIDTLAKFRAMSKVKMSYQDDYNALDALKKLAYERKVCILVIHHFRKMRDDEDPFSQISGTTGLTGAADTNLIFVNDKNHCTVMHIQGRDVESQEIGMKFDLELSTWSLADSSERLNPERRAIIDVLRQSNKPMSPKEIADALGKTDRGASVRQLLMKMEREEDVIKAGWGIYSLPNNNHHDGNDDNTDHIDNNIMIADDTHDHNQ